MTMPFSRPPSSSTGKVRFSEARTASSMSRIVASAGSTTYSSSMTSRTVSPFRSEKSMPLLTLSPHRTSLRVNADSGSNSSATFMLMTQVIISGGIME